MEWLHEAEYFTATPRCRKYACINFLPERPHDTKVGDLSDI